MSFFVENDGDSAISVTINQQTFIGVPVQLKDEPKLAEAAKVSAEFVAEVFTYITSICLTISPLHCLCDGYYYCMTAYTIRYNTIEEFNVDSKAEYTA